MPGCQMNFKSHAYFLYKFSNFKLPFYNLCEMLYVMNSNTVIEITKTLINRNSKDKDNIISPSFLKKYHLETLSKLINFSRVTQLMYDKVVPGNTFADIMLVLFALSPVVIRTLFFFLQFYSLLS